MKRKNLTREQRDVALVNALVWIASTVFQPGEFGFTQRQLRQRRRLLKLASLLEVKVTRRRA